MPIGFHADRLSLDGDNFARLWRFRSPFWALANIQKHDKAFQTTVLARTSLCGRRFIFGLSLPAFWILSDFD
jgi:hypothetical protein